MTSAFEPDSWERVAAELRAFRETQKQAWGDIDNTTLGRYLADEVTTEERQHIEQAIDERPELRLLTDLVRDVLTEFEPATATVPAAPEKRILSFPTPAAKQSGSKKWLGASLRQRSALAAAACLLLVLGVSLNSSGNPDPLPPFKTEGAVAQRLLPGRDSVVVASVKKPFAKVAALPPLMQLDEAERRAQALNIQGRLREELALRQQLPELARRAQKNDDSFLVANLNRIGQIYQAQGDLPRAESNYNKARAICQDKFGPDHPCTNQTDCCLAQVYSSALNNPYFATSRPEQGLPGAAYQVTRAGGQLNLPASTHQGAVPRNAAALADSIIRKHPGEVRKSVVPALVRGLQQSSSALDRLAYIQALARLGPAAQDAVPVLAEVLQKSQDATERQVVVQALGQMGPTADKALTVLVEATNSSCPEVCKAAAESLLSYGPEGVVALRHLKDRGEVRQQQFAQTALDRAGPRHVCVGVKDACELFTVGTIAESRNDLLLLASQRKLPVYIETVDDSTRKGNKDRDAETRELVSAQSVYLLIHKEPGRVEIRVPEALRQSGLSLARQKELQTLLEKPLKARDYDQALRLTTRFLTETNAK